MKKIITITLLVLLTVGLFVACNADAVETVFNTEKEEGECLCFTAEVKDATVQLQKKGTGTPTDIDLVYSIDGVNFQEYTFPDTGNEGKTITLAKGEKVYFKAKETNGSFANGTEDEVNTCIKIENYYQFYIPEKMSCSGNIMYLLDSTGTRTDVPPYAFAYLFGGAEITTAPELPATKLAIGCYYGMFTCCPNLTTAPKLPATTLAKYCYNNMFVTCEHLTTAPALPATDLAESCYAYMFDNCQELTTAPALPATTLAEAERCYAGMFRRCSALITAPALPATTLEEGCYEYMFDKCQELTTAPALPAKTMEKGCYAYMFTECSKLTTAPALPAKTLEERCYYGMFNGCSKLDSVTMLATNFSAQDCLTYWLYGVAEEGTIYIDSTQTENLVAGKKGIPSKWDVKKATWSVIGDFAGFNWNKDFMMTETEQNVFVSPSITFKAGEQFKVRRGLDWEEGDYGAPKDGANPLVFTSGTSITATNKGYNIAVPEDGNYIIILDLSDEGNPTITVKAHPTFKAVYDSTNGNNTLTFYYDNKDHSGENIIVYENGTKHYLYSTIDDVSGVNLTGSDRWGYHREMYDNSVHSVDVNDVIIDESVKNYKDLQYMGYMFSNFTQLETLDLSNFDISNVTFMFGMVRYCSELKSLKISSFNASNVENMGNMFQGCSNLVSVIIADENLKIAEQLGEGWSYSNGAYTKLK